MKHHRLRSLLAASLGVLVSCSLSLAAASSASSIASRLQPFVTSNTLAGAVALVATKDEVLTVETAGFADIAARKPMKPDTLFWIASQSKSLTAAAVMMLVDEGKLSLDDPVEKHLPEFKGQMVAVERDADHVLLRNPTHPITVREILNHTSGLPFKSPMEEPTLDGLPLRDAVRSYAMGPLQFQPGTKYQYSNAGINTAGRLIEVLTGMPYEKFMEKRLFQPLGMKDTTFWPNERQVKRLAKSYKPARDKSGLEETPIVQLRYPLSDPTRGPMPAGGYFSAAGDTAKFCQMILNGGTFHGQRLLSEAAIQELTKRQTPPELKESYGLGFTVGPDGCGHGGAHATNMTIDPKRGLILVWMVQHMGFPGNGSKAQGVFRQTALEHFAR